MKIKYRVPEFWIYIPRHHSKWSTLLIHKQYFEIMKEIMHVVHINSWILNYSSDCILHKTRALHISLSFVLQINQQYFVGLSELLYSKIPIRSLYAKCMVHPVCGILCETDKTVNFLAVDVNCQWIYYSFFTCSYTEKSLAQFPCRSRKI